MNTTAQTPVTRYLNGFHGKSAETLINVNGQEWKITTMKRHNGSLSSSAMKVKTSKSNGFEVTEFDSSAIFQAKQLISERISRVTEKAIKEQHEKALLIFDAQKDAGEIPTEKPQTPEIGTIIFTDGYGNYKGSEGNKWIVFEVNGRGYNCVEMDTLEIRYKDYVKPYSEKFGIGSYFEPDYKFDGTEDDLANLVISAKQKAEADKIEAQKVKEEQEKETARKIEEGRDLVNVPDGAVGLVVAKLFEDDSDIMTDYFNTKCVKTVYLGFSFSKRNNPHELKKMALNFPEAAELLKDETAEIKEGYNGLPHYYFGTSRNSGWKLTKTVYDVNFNSEETLNKLRIAAAEGRYFVKNEEVQEKQEAVNIEGLNVQIVDYSEKAIAVIGDTKEIKEELKSLGGRFNKFLTVEGVRQAGWIFQKSKKEDLQNLLKFE